MAPAPAPERIFTARRAAAVERLIGFGIPRGWVKRWVEEYEERSDPLEGRFAATYWDTVYERVVARYVGGEKPPPRRNERTR